MHWRLEGVACLPCERRACARALLDIRVSACACVCMLRCRPVAGCTSRRPCGMGVGCLRLLLLGAYVHVGGELLRDVSFLFLHASFWRVLLPLDDSLFVCSLFFWLPPWACSSDFVFSCRPFPMGYWRKWQQYRLVASRWGIRGSEVRSSARGSVQRMPLINARAAYHVDELEAPASPTRLLLQGGPLKWDNHSLLNCHTHTRCA